MSTKSKDDSDLIGGEPQAKGSAKHDHEQTKTYKAVQPISHNGKRVDVGGEVDLTLEQAQRLKAVGAI